MVNIFTRSLSDELTSLVKKLDDVVGKNEDAKMAGFVVLLTDDADAAEAELTALAKKHGIKNIPLTYFDGLAGPPSYKIAKDAETTVHYWSGATVVANHAFAKGKLDKAASKKIVADSAKVLE